MTILSVEHPHQTGGRVDAPRGPADGRWPATLYAGDGLGLIELSAVATRTGCCASWSGAAVRATYALDLRPPDCRWTLTIAAEAPGRGIEAATYTAYVLSCDPLMLAFPAGP